jgi:hypothetical protein
MLPPEPGEAGTGQTLDDVAHGRDKVRGQSKLAPSRAENGPLIVGCERAPDGYCEPAAPVQHAERLTDSPLALLKVPKVAEDEVKLLVKKRQSCQVVDHAGGVLVTLIS